MGSYTCEINGTNATACDEIVINGSLTFQAVAANPFTIRLASLTAGNTPGAMPGFNKFANYNWTIATASGGVQNLTAGNCVVNTSSFNNDFSGGSFSVTNEGNAIEIRYASALAAPTWNSFGPLNNASFPLSFSGPNGQTYKILTSPDLTLPLSSWIVLTNGTFEAGPAIYVDTAATSDIRFYRVVSP